MGVALALVAGSAVTAAPRVAAGADRAHFADGYVWAFSPTTPSYDADGSYAFNRGGGAITITRAAVGQYSVRFARLSALLGGSNVVHVTGYSGNDDYCKPTAPRLVKDKIGVLCFDGDTGAVVDSYFTVFVTRPYPDLAYASGTATGNNYHPSSSSAYNPSGAIKAFHTGTGLYKVVFKGLGASTGSNGGDVQVNSVGTDATSCETLGWSGSIDLTVNVFCFGAAGDVDSAFNVLFVLPSANLAYIWDNDPTSASFTSPYYTANPSGGGATVSHLGLGRWSVTWSGLSLLDGGDVQVTAYGGNGGQCKVEGWSSDTATVRCFASGYGLVDVDFAVFFAS
jgi:hypothetical protein